MAHAAVLAPLTPIADALALGSAQAKPGFAYGWVRGAGSAAFIAGALRPARLVEPARARRHRLAQRRAARAGRRLRAAGAQPRRRTAGAQARARAGAAAGLLRIPVFRRLMLVAALIGGSHALHDGFEVIRWRAAGLSAGQAACCGRCRSRPRWWCSCAWAAAAATGSAPAARCRCRPWPGSSAGAAAQTAWFPAMALVEPLHGLTFALLHLACMDMIARVVPAELAATAQAFYATVAMGAPAPRVTLASGPLYGRVGAGAFWAMAAMCALAVPVAGRIAVRPA